MSKQELIKFEKRIAKRFDDGEIPYLTHFSGGNEDQLIEIFQDIKPGDYVFSTHRSHYHYLLHGGDPERLEKLILDGKSMFVFDRELNFYASSIVCSTPAIAAGVAWALKRNGSDKKVWCFIGDGAEDEGHFVEAARYVDGWNLPCTFILEDNDRSVSATKEERWGKYEALRFKCLRSYYYEPTYPHGGTNTPGWIDFKAKPVREEMIPSTRLWDTKPNKEGYKDAVIESMNLLSDAGCIFIGYNVRHASAYGTLNDVPLSQRLETPLAENLMAGLAVGMTMEGFRPVLYFERHDFIFNALDALVHQVDMIETISGGQFTAPIIIKAVVGGMYPFYAGITHTSDYTQMCRDLFYFPVFAPSTAEEVGNVYEYALGAKGPVMVSERKELY
jgi:pyruvate dehydrogenase E1 component alpha subunit